MREYKIRTASGFFDFDNLENSDISLQDIATALSRNNRFTGHTKKPYTVAQHSAYVGNLMGLDELSDRLQLLGVIHDFHEAYFSDMSSPLKWYLKDKLGFDANAYCETIDAAIYKKLGIEPPTEEEHRIVKEYDMRAYDHERFYVFDLGDEIFVKEDNDKVSNDHKLLEDFMKLNNVFTTQDLWAEFMVEYYEILKEQMEKENGN